MFLRILVNTLLKDNTQYKNSTKNWLIVVEMLILPFNVNPIAIQETTVKRLKKNNGSSRTARKIAVRVPNPAVKSTDIFSPLLLLQDLLDDSKPLDHSLFVLPPPSDNSMNA